MSLVNLSLDEIIARRRGTDKKSNGSTNRFRSNRKKRDFAPEYSTTNSAFTRPEASLLIIYGRTALQDQSLHLIHIFSSSQSNKVLEDVPSGKWDHSGFEEMYGNGSGDGSSPLPALERGGRFNRVDLARKVRLHITNLAPTVNSADLNELFEEYSIISANVNYDEMGESVGTADVVTDRVTAREIVANLDGVALDGEVMSFHMIDDQTIPASRNVPVKNRLSFRERSWGVIKKRPPKRPLTGIKNRRKNRSKRPQMTDEELDRELEEYMNKRGHQKQEEQKMEKMEI
uniref:RRM domain-containing protein n=1 Tax=Loa loa TaxID=7209 RepID=A0A1I7VH24_LOALO